MRIKISKVDKLFSLYIRERDKWTCQRCRKYHPPPTGALHCSHFWGRSNSCTRFDPLNCDALCYGCHSEWEGNKQGDYRTFKLDKLGTKEYNELEKRARSICKRKKEEEKTLEWLTKINGSNS